jgi:hypothetical protein
MDCQNFKELIDSYLCGELAVETNHTVLCHAERCCPCRNEMAARRLLRASLRQACSREKMSEQAIEQLRARLRSEAGLGDGSARLDEEVGAGGWFATLFRTRLLAPAAVVVALALLIGGIRGLRVLQRGDGDPRRLSHEQIMALELSATLVAETVGDHRTCGAYYVGASGPAEMPDSVREFDPACSKLDKIAADGATGLQLRAAHVCDFGGRRFAHLVYTRDTTLISLFVTGRDSRAMKSGAVPAFSGPALGTQRFTHDHIAIGAYQTARRIVLVTSDLPENENAALAEKLAKPVAEYLRTTEAGSGVEERIGRLNPREMILNR